ncbi:hypothetical protein CALVIDRAFT_481011, partial [Calocera viscosa TUFC12733]
MLSQGWKTEGFPLRDGDLHKRRAARVYSLQHSNTRKRKVDDYVKRYGCRWSELCRLPYFNPMTMAVLDPMHMLLQGLTKSLWYYTWVQGGKEKIKVLREGTEAGTQRELDEIHEVLRTFEMPTWYARLPTKVGYPAGGSLTSDEWRALAVVYGPAVVSGIVDVGPSARHQHITYDVMLVSDDSPDTNTSHMIQKNAKQKSQVPPTQSVEDIQHDEEQLQASLPPRPRVHPDAAQNYLKFATVLKIYMRREITERDIERASRLYLDFFEEYIYGASNVTPTFHWITHLAAQIHRYGPVHGFWTFIFERLNKFLKAFNTSGHKGGVVEVTFAREFKREISLTCMVS